MTKKYNRGISEAQSNALALERRSAPYTAASGVSFTVAWNYHNREPKDLREAVRMVRAAYADEVPGRMHNRDIADDGTPKMTPQAEGYIFGSDTAGENGSRCSCAAQRTNRDASPGTPTTSGRSRPIEQAALPVELTPRGSSVHQDDCPMHPSNRAALDFYRTPFRAALENLRRSSPNRAGIVSHVAIGSQSPIQSAITEGVPAWCARLVSEDTLRAFLRNMSDVKVHLPKEDAA